MASIGTVQSPAITGEAAPVFMAAERRKVVAEVSTVVQASKTQLSAEVSKAVQASKTQLSAEVAELKALVAKLVAASKEDALKKAPAKAAE